MPKPHRILLIYPCSAGKPYYKSRSYRLLFKTLSSLGDLRKEIHLVTISEPFALIPEEFYGKKTKWHDWESSWYDCPGLFKWWCLKHGQIYKEEHLEKCIQILAYYISNFLKRVKLKECYSRIIAFVRTYSSGLRKRKDHTHRRIIELASKIANVQVYIHPPKEVVAEIVSKNGRLAWDMYGVAHPIAQEYLRSLLLNALSDGEER